MNTLKAFAIGWDAGPSAQIEVFSPGVEAKPSPYRMKFTPPFRATIRPPMKELKLGPTVLDRMRVRFKELGIAGEARGPEAVAALPLVNEVLEETKSFGSRLLALVAPDDVQGELNASDLYLEIGVDEQLIDYPWELLHDGGEFLCLKHRVGRFVNATRQTAPPGRAPSPWKEGPLSVLLISVPQPQKRPGAREFEKLPGAQSETEAITQILAELGGAAKVHLLRGPDATSDAVWDAIKGSERYHIVHFNGHAYFDANQPDSSSLVLFDDNMDAGEILAYFQKKPPVLAFMNACETGAGAGEHASSQYEIFGLARAFLDTGAYLIGNRWKVGDVGAAEFARSFYTNLIRGYPLGRAVRDARICCKDKMPAHDFSWASYIFYGDPRLCFRRILD